MNVIEDLLQSALAASPSRRKDALRVLRGQAVAGVPGTPATVTEPYLTLRQLCARLSVSRFTIWRWRPPSHDVGGQPRFRLTEVEAYLRSEDFRRRTAALRAERRDQTPARKAAPLPSSGPTPQNP